MFLWAPCGALVRLKDAQHWTLCLLHLTPHPRHPEHYTSWEQVLIYNSDLADGECPPTEWMTNGWMGNNCAHYFMIKQLLKEKVGAWIRKPFSIWCDLMKHNLHCIKLIRLLIVACGILPKLLFNGCAKLLDIGGNWNTLLYTSIQSFPNMLKGWVCMPWNWDIFSFQELCTDSCEMGPCIMMLKHEVKAANEWPQDLCEFKLPSIKCICVRCL